MIDNKIVENCKLGSYFINDELSNNLSQSEINIATKKDRLEKWFKMVCYGLDTDIAHKTISKNDYERVLKFDGTDFQPIEFTAYAHIGL